MMIIHDKIAMPSTSRHFSLVKLGTLKIQFLAFVFCMMISFFKLVFQYFIKLDPTRSFMYVSLVAGSLYVLPVAQGFEKMSEKTLTMMSEQVLTMLSL